MDKFTTIYFTEDYEPTDQEIVYFEQAIEREVSDGDGFINVYTTDKRLVNDLVSLIGNHYIKEIAY